MKKLISLKKVVLFAALTLLCPNRLSAQGWMAIAHNSQDVWDIPFQKVRVRPAEVGSFVLPKDFTVTFSEKPNKAKPVGIYNAHCANGYVRNGSKEKIRIEAMTHVGDGWYEYDFGQTLYVQKIGTLVGYNDRDPILIQPTGDYALPESATPSLPRGTHSANSYAQNSQSSGTNGNLGEQVSMPDESKYQFALELWPVKKVTKIANAGKVIVEYENGDRIEITNGGMFGNDPVFIGNIHLKDGNILEAVDHDVMKLHYSDGRVFTGAFSETMFLSGPANELSKLQKYPTLTPSQGFYTLADGTKEEVQGGKTAKEREADRLKNGPFNPTVPGEMATLKKQASEGNGFANASLALCYYTGWGTQKSSATALKYCEKALTCDKDNSVIFSNDKFTSAYQGARMLRGVILFEGGQGVAKNQAKAFKDLEQTCSFNYQYYEGYKGWLHLLGYNNETYALQAACKATRYLANCYEKGIGCVGDLDKALGLWVRNTSDAESMYKMGYYTMKCRWKPIISFGRKYPNTDVARYFYRSAAEMGHKQAKVELQKLGN